MCICICYAIALQDSIDALNRTQTRGIEGQLYNKVNELQEDLSMKKFDLRAKQIHLAAIRAQVSFVLYLFGEKLSLSCASTLSKSLSKLKAILFVCFWHLLMSERALMIDIHLK